MQTTSDAAVFRFALVALRNARGQVLMQERDAHTPNDPLRWGLPGGDREEGETPLVTATRELREETRLTGVELTGPVFSRHFSPQHGWLDFAIFSAVADLADEDVECHEGLQMVFRDVADLPGLDLARPAARALLETVPGFPEPHTFAGVILVDREGRILLQERDEHPRIDPEKWGLAGGHVEPGEEFEPAAYRELEEETGVVLAPGELALWGEFIVDHREAYGTWDRMQVFVGATDLTDGDIDCHEGRQIVFVDPDRARGLPLTHAAADVVPLFLESTLYRSLWESA